LKLHRLKPMTIAEVLWADFWVSDNIASLDLGGYINSATIEFVGGLTLKNFFSILLLTTAFVACGDKKEGTSPPVDQAKLDSASEALCPENQKFQVSNENFSLGNGVLPNPALFAIQKGGDTCASLHNIDHGGTTSWLRVDYSTDCILNGSLWAFDSLSVQDSINVYFNLKSLDTPENQWIHIYTSHGYSTRSLNSEMGLVIYSCAH